MQHLIDIVGLMAAALTSLSYIPQVRKAWPRGSTGDLSLKMLAVLAAGLATWIAYGILKGDYVIILANTVGVSLVAALFFRMAGSSLASLQAISGRSGAFILTAPPRNQESMSGGVP